jgi:hypothetical protein
MEKPRKHVDWAAPTARVPDGVRSYEQRGAVEVGGSYGCMCPPLLN